MAHFHIPLRRRPSKSLLKLHAQAQAPDGEIEQIKQRAKPRHIEDDIQMAGVKSLRQLLLPHVRMNHSPAGGFRAGWAGERFKRMGTFAGWLDLEFVWSTQGLVVSSVPLHNVRFIEVKSDTGPLTESQKEFIQWLDASFIPWRLARSAVQIVEMARELGVPMLAHKL